MAHAAQTWLQVRGRCQRSHPVAQLLLKSWCLGVCANGQGGCGSVRGSCWPFWSRCLTHHEDLPVVVS